MFSSPSGIYRSKVLSSIVRQTRRWSDRGKSALRRVQVAASWSAQILLYPIYALFQTSRVMAAQVYQTLQLGIPSLKSPGISISPPPSGSSSEPALLAMTVDTPISTVLQTIQEFALPIGVPVLLEGASAIAPLSGVAGVTLGAIPALATERGMAIPGTSVFIQGIATLLDTAAVVLVTNQNQILDILTPEQQARLHYRITWEVASYGRYFNLRKTFANLSLLRLRGQSESHDPTDSSGMVEQFAQGLAVLGRQCIQAIQYVGSETYRIGRLGLFGRSLATREALTLPGGALFTATVDTPLEKALQTVQQFPLPMHLLASLLESPSAQPELAAATPDQSQSSAGWLLSQATQIPPILTIPPEFAALPTLYVRGVASQLDTQAIVLVTNQNQTLNLLSPEQQEHVRQRIIWTVAHFYRYQQIRRSVRHSFSRLRPPESQVLLPIRGFYQLMAWLQSGSVAIATNLFQEARLAAHRVWATEPSLLDLMLPDWSYAHSTAPGNPSLPPVSPTSPRRLAPSWLETLYQRYRIWLNSRTGQAAIAQAPGLGLSVRPNSAIPPEAEQPSIDEDQPLLSNSSPTLGLEFGSTARQVLLSWQESALALANSADIWDSYAPSPHFSNPAATAVSVSSSNPATEVTSAPSDYIDIQATLLGYLHSPLERLLQWLDRLLLWLEDTVIQLWRWWQQVRRDRP